MVAIIEHLNLYPIVDVIIHQLAPLEVQQLILGVLLAVAASRTGSTVVATSGAVAD